METRLHRIILVSNASKVLMEAWDVISIQTPSLCRVVIDWAKAWGRDVDPNTLILSCREGLGKGLEWGRLLVYICESSSNQSIGRLIVYNAVMVGFTAKVILDGRLKPSLKGKADSICPSGALLHIRLPTS